VKHVVLAAVLFLAAAPAEARPVVVELFTSEACSSCPPAEALLRDLKSSNSNVLPLSFHVTYWDSPAWKDKYSLIGATDRQSFYAGAENSQTVYTPEAVIDGVNSMNGADKAAVTAAIAAAAQSQPPAIPVTVSGGAMVTVAIGAGAAPTDLIWLFGFDSQHITKIGGGENGGATLTEVNVVRSITSLGGGAVQPTTMTIPRPAGEHMAVIIQAQNGQVLGAAAD